eukprot:gene27545-2412_t
MISSDVKPSKVCQRELIFTSNSGQLSAPFCSVSGSISGSISAEAITTMGKDWDKTGYRKGKDVNENLKAITALGSHVKALLYKVDERQNFTDEVFTSVLNQGSDMVSAFAVMYGVNDGCFYASMIVLGINAAVRLVIGLATYCSDDVETKSTCKVVAGLGWGMIEPVSGNAILASG